MRTRPFLIALVVFAVIAAACGSDDATTADSPTNGSPESEPEASAAPAQATTATAAPVEPITTTAVDPDPDADPGADANADAEDPSPDTEGRIFVGADGVETDVSDTSRIVSLNGDITEIIYELGMGESVVAIDVTTTHPASAAELPVVGFGQDLAAEGVLAFQPTLVIGDQQIEPAETLQQLRDAGVPVAIIETATSLDGVAPKISTVADILGVDGGALVDRVQGEIDDALDLATGAEDTPGVAFVYARGPQVILLFGAGMPTQSIIEGAGATDVGAASGVFGAAPLTPEALVAAAPEVIVLPEAGLGALGGPEAFAAVPGVAETPAGVTGSFLAYDEAFFFNLGPRAGQALRQFVLDLHPELG